MQLGLSFTLLLASLLVAFSTVDAAPLKRQNSGMVTLPLKRVHGPRDGVHPQVVRVPSSLSIRNSLFEPVRLPPAPPAAHQPVTPPSGANDRPCRPLQRGTRLLHR